MILTFEPTKLSAVYDQTTIWTWLQTTHTAGIKRRAHDEKIQPLLQHSWWISMRNASCTLHPSQ
jgi:hypothetical protein